jgi:hypothetical protein
MTATRETTEELKGVVRTSSHHRRARWPRQVHKTTIQTKNRRHANRRLLVPPLSISGSQALRPTSTLKTEASNRKQNPLPHQADCGLLEQRL